MDYTRRDFPHFHSLKYDSFLKADDNGNPNVDMLTYMSLVDGVAVGSYSLLESLLLDPNLQCWLAGLSTQRSNEQFISLISNLQAQEDEEGLSLLLFDMTAAAKSYVYSCSRKILAALFFQDFYVGILTHIATSARMALGVKDALTALVSVYMESALRDQTLD